MATDVRNDLADFEASARECLDDQSYGVVADALNSYRRRQEQLQRLRGELAPALEQSRRGESKEIDFEEFLAEARRRAAEKGIPD
jgi:hypothetical protein